MIGAEFVTFPPKVFSEILIKMNWYFLAYCQKILCQSEILFSWRHVFPILPFLYQFYSKNSIFLRQKTELINMTKCFFLKIKLIQRIYLITSHIFFLRVVENTELENFSILTTFDTLVGFYFFHLTYSFRQIFFCDIITIFDK